MTIFDYALTLDQEVQAVWQRPWTATSILLLSIRWVMIALSMAQFASTLDTLVRMFLQIIRVNANCLLEVRGI